MTKIKTTTKNKIDPDQEGKTAANPIQDPRPARPQKKEKAKRKRKLKVAASRRNFPMSRRAEKSFGLGCPLERTFRHLRDEKIEVKISKFVRR
jgi:hypothetical protein